MYGSVACTASLPFTIAPDGGAVHQKDFLMKPSEKQILDRAHELWEQNGRPDGREDEFWHLAERELEAEEHNNPNQKRDK
jgi:Protein of unknown function (DUF2934)